MVAGRRPRYTVTSSSVYPFSSSPASAPDSPTSAHTISEDTEHFEVSLFEPDVEDPLASTRMTSPKYHLRLVVKNNYFLSRSFQTCAVRAILSRHEKGDPGGNADLFGYLPRQRIQVKPIKSNVRLNTTSYRFYNGATFATTSPFVEAVHHSSDNTPDLSCFLEHQRLLALRAGTDLALPIVLPLKSCCNRVSLSNPFRTVRTI